MSSELDTEKQRYSELEERKGRLEAQLQETEDWKSTCVCRSEHPLFTPTIHREKTNPSGLRLYCRCTVVDWMA